MEQKMNDSKEKKMKHKSRLQTIIDLASKLEINLGASREMEVELTAKINRMKWYLKNSKKETKDLMDENILL